MYTTYSYRNNLIISPFLWWLLQYKHLWWTNVRWEFVLLSWGGGVDPGPLLMSDLFFSKSRNVEVAWDTCPSLWYPFFLVWLMNAKMLTVIDSNLANSANSPGPWKYYAPPLSISLCYYIIIPRMLRVDWRVELNSGFATRPPRQPLFTNNFIYWILVHI